MDYPVNVNKPAKILCSLEPTLPLNPHHLGESALFPQSYTLNLVTNQSLGMVPILARYIHILKLCFPDTLVYILSNE